MISYLNGKILNKQTGYIILNVNNIGYKIFLYPAFLADLEIDEEKSFYIYQKVREDALELYGFRSIEELEMFELLLSISGVGPKSALGVIGVAEVDEIKASIGSGDPSILTKVSGIGKKTAERVVLELREKIGYIASPANSSSGAEANFVADEIDALTALGYTLDQARSALKQVDPEISDSGERIRSALRTLG